MQRKQQYMYTTNIHIYTNRVLIGPLMTATGKLRLPIGRLSKSTRIGDRNFPVTVISRALKRLNVNGL